MNTLATFCRLAAMRRRAGASVVHSLGWAGGLLWRSHQTSRRRRVDRRAEVESAVRQRL